MKRAFSTGERYVWSERTFEVRKLLRDNKLNILWLDTQEYDTVAASNLAVAQSQGDLRPEKSYSVIPIERQLDWADFSEGERRVAEYRLEVLKPLLDLSGAALNRAVNEHVRELRREHSEAEPCEDSRLRACSAASIRRWLSQLKAAGGDPRALVPKRRKQSAKSRRRCHEESIRIAEGAVEDLRYLGTKRSVKSVHREVLLRIDDENRQRLPDDQLPDVSLSTVYRLAREIDVERRLIRARGARGRPVKTMQVGQMDYLDTPLARVEIDHTILDIILVDERHGVPLKRPTLTMAFDVASRNPIGYCIGFDPPSVLTAMECLRHSILPKLNTKERFDTQNDWEAYGIPRELVIDNGKEFIGKDLEDACMLLGITLLRSPVKNPEFKAAVERSFGTLNTTIIHSLPGTTHSNILDRGDYDSLNSATLTLKTFEKIFVKTIVDVYAQDLHSGLGTTPAARWNELTSQGFFPLTRSAEELRSILGRVAYRTVQHDGIRFINLRYNSPELASMRVRYGGRSNQKFKIKYDPNDLGEIRVFDPDEAVYVTVPALRSDYATGLSEWAHRAVCARARENYGRVDHRALGQALREIDALVNESIAETKKARTLHALPARWGEATEGHAMLPEPMVAGPDTARPAVEDDEALTDEDFEFSEEELRAMGAELAPHPRADDDESYFEWDLEEQSGDSDDDDE